MNLTQFLQPNMFLSLKDFFEQLNIPVNYISEEPSSAQDILTNTFKAGKMPYALMDKVYFLGMVDDAAFDGNKSLEVEKIKSDYDGILIFGVTLRKRGDGLLPTRTYIAEITRSFNREFHYTPVVVVFQYKDKEDKQHITFANSERLAYKQEWREGEKAGKVSMLKDINVADPHRGHIDILKELKILRSGKKAINSFDDIYKYWQEVFNVSVLNKKFYKELSHWYFWALNEDKGKVKFPNEPKKDAYSSYEKYQEAVKEHKGKNIIRLLTRILFVWFIKEKGLIPEELFDPVYLKDKLLKDLAPEHEQGNLFALVDLNSFYYKGILQNLFFATLNQEMGKRTFRKKEQNQGVTNLMRYQDFFHDADHFVELVEKVVPFMNGGLFECLDKEPIPDNSHLIDGFSERKANDLQVPDFLFFDSHEVLDLSADYGSKSKAYKKAETKGLIRILESYKFTISENTPIEQEIALDPELLGKVFENLLASYNPETKSTARKQTGSFYTPREIVNYMVDESLIAYLKTDLLVEETNELEQTKLDEQLHQLFSYEATNPFKEDEEFTKKIIHALDHCKILDPACGSGAFPMGVLHKMVYVLDKLDPNNEKWKQRQISKANLIEDANIRDEAIENIEEAFDNNELDYGRKLFLIENCIYGVDIQPIATQISKLRFFISLIVDQKVDRSKVNFGIRPLPNLETKFVSANTLIGIEKETNLFDTDDVRTLEIQLKNNRQKIFSAKTPKTKKKYREEDKTLRETIGSKLESYGMSTNTAQQLAGWNPFDQNASAGFLDMEWMFGIKKGFDIVIGNPPYLLIQNIPNLNSLVLGIYNSFQSAQYKVDLYHLFIEMGLKLSSKNGVLTYITPNTFIKNKHNNKLRKLIINESDIISILLFYSRVFESVTVDNIIFSLQKGKRNNNTKVYEIHSSINEISTPIRIYDQNKIIPPSFVFNFDLDDKKEKILSKIEDSAIDLKSIGRAYFGIQTFDRNIYVSKVKHNSKWKSVIDGSNVLPFKILPPKEYVQFESEAIKSGGKPEVYNKDRIVIRQIGKYPEGAYCPPQMYTLNTIYNIFLKDEKINIRYVLAIINSLVIRYYWLVLNFDNKGTFPKIKKEPIESLPIKVNMQYQSLVITFVKIIEYSKVNDSHFLLFKMICDGLIFDIYFPGHMKEKQINIIESVEEDILEVLGKKDFEPMSNPEKENIIESLYEKWTHPDNEIRNRIKLFAVRSPDILKPILESK